VLATIDTISRKELEQQAAAFARNTVAFLEKQNSESKSQREPLVSPRDRTGLLEMLYTRFVARYRTVAP
jgi:hypothetical protein